MRDIREDLFERMEAATAEMASARTQYDHERRELEQRFQKLFDMLATRQRALAVLLDEETKSHGQHDYTPPAVKEYKLPFQDFVLNLLDTSGPLGKETIKEMSLRAGYGGESESVGRMLHTTLMNLVKAHKLQTNNSGDYEVTHRVRFGHMALLDVWAEQPKGSPPVTESEPD